MKKKKIKTCANSRRGCIKEVLAPVNQFQINSKGFCDDPIWYKPVISSLHPCTDLETQKTCGFIYSLTLPVHFLFRLLHTWLTTYQQLSKDKAQQSSKVGRAEKSIWTLTDSSINYVINVHRLWVIFAILLV